MQLEVETGLGRGGFTADGAARRRRATWPATPGVRLASAWTHFQAPADAARTAAQVAAFERATGDLVANGIPLPRRHVAASGGLLLEHVVSLDGVRPGLAIVRPACRTSSSAGGGGRAVEGAADLRPALSLHARPVRVADLPAGWGISYGPSFTTSRPSRIATLPLGYGDGWPRSLSNRATALVRGRRVPLVGNVAMDAVMADVTDVPGPPVGVGDEFVLIGAQGDERITAAELAAARGTISWEVVTNLSARLPRVYHAASVPRETRTLVADEVERQEVHATVSELGGLGDEQRDELVEEVAREIQLRGLTASAVHFLQASRPYRPLGSNAMLFFDPVLRGLFGGDMPGASALLADEDGIEQLIERLEDLSEETGWDA